MEGYNFRGPFSPKMYSKSFPSAHVEYNYIAMHPVVSIMVFVALIKCHVDNLFHRLEYRFKGTHYAA